MSMSHSDRKYDILKVDFLSQVHLEFYVLL